MLTQEELRINFNNNKYPQMPQAKIMAFMAEFPWLKEHLGISNVKRIYVQRVELKLLDYIPSYCCDDEENYEETIIFLDENGDGIYPPGNLGIKFIDKIIDFIHEVSYSYPIHSPLINELERLGKNLSRVCYVYSYLDGNNGRGGSVIIYKLPNDISASKLVVDYNKNLKQMIAIERKTIQDAEK